MENVSREDLYRLVWSEPIAKLAPKFSLSDRGLGKLCARYDIPVPPRGYWAKKAAGKRVSQQALPPRTGADPNPIVISQTTAGPSAPAPPKELDPAIQFERDPANRIVVNPSTRLKHPLVIAAAENLRTRTISGPYTPVTARQLADIRVTPKLVSRALRIMQALFSALEQRGYSVAVANGKTAATVLGEPIEFYLRERHRQRFLTLNADEQRRQREGLWVHDRELRASGELSLQIGDYLGRSVSDKPKTPLEDQLNRFIEVLVTQALRDKAWRVAREQEERKRQELERRRLQVERRRREAEARVQQFEGLVTAWRHVRQQRQFLEELRTSIGDVNVESELGRWLTWAAQHVDHADPLSRFRTRGQLLTVYYATSSSEIERINNGGAFGDGNVNRGTDGPKMAGMELVDEAPEATWNSDALQLELPDQLLLPYEITKPGYRPRRFCVPKRVIDAHFGRTGAAEDQDPS